MRFDEIEFDCSLLDLATKQKFHVTRARGSGITFRARLKVAAPAATEEHVRNLPPIDSLGPVAFMPSEPPSPAEWNDELWHLWTVEIDDAIAEHVREVWIEGGRLQGDARVTGGFLLKPMRAAYVGPAHVKVRSGSVALGGRTVAEPLVADVDFELSRFDPRYSDDTDLFPRISLSVDAKAEIPDLDNLSLSLPDSGHVRGRVTIPRLAIRIVKGVLRDESHLDAHGATLLFTTAAHVVSGGVDLTADVANDELTARASVERLDADLALSVPRVILSADSAALDLLSPFDDLHGVLDVPEAELPQAARLAAALPKSAPFRIERGQLRASLHAEGWRAEERVRGNVRVQAKNLHVATEELHVHGDATVEASIGSFFLETRRATDVRVDVDVPDGQVAPGAFPGESFVHLLGLRAHADAADLDADHPLRSLRASIAVPAGELFDRDSARATLGIGAGPRLVSRRARFAASADVAIDGDRWSGTLDAHAPGLGLESDGRRVVLALSAHARARSGDRRGTLSFDDARVVATHIVLSDGASPSALSIARLSVAAASPAFSFVVADPSRGSNS